MRPLLDRAILHPHHKNMKYAALSSIFLAGCASLDTRMPEIDAGLVETEQTRQALTAMDEIDRLRDRYHRIADRILTANADLCDRQFADIGIVTQTIDNYPEALRETISAELGIGDTPQIVYVRPGSPADVSGMTKGDQIKDQSGEYLDFDSDRLQSILKQGVPLTLSRGEIESALEIEPVTRCGYHLKLKMTPTINAYARGKSIVMTAGMLNFVETDLELAYVIGHELAHNTHGHIRKTIANYILSGFATRYTRPFEAEADYIGLYYMARAGYALDDVENLWRRLARQNVKSIYKAKTHPTFPQRTLLIQAARAEIKAKQAAGEPLIPNRKSGMGKE